MPDAKTAGDLAIIATGIGAAATAVATAWFQARKKGDDDKPSTAIVGGLVDSRAARDLTDAISDHRRTIIASDQDRRSDDRELRDSMRRLCEALDRNTEASRLDALPESIRDQLHKLDRTS